MNDLTARIVQYFESGFRDLNQTWCKYVLWCKNVGGGISGNVTTTSKSAVAEFWELLWNWEFDFQVWQPQRLDFIVVLTQSHHNGQFYSSKPFAIPQEPFWCFQTWERMGSSSSTIALCLRFLIIIILLAKMEVLFYCLLLGSVYAGRVILAIVLRKRILCLTSRQCSHYHYWQYVRAACMAIHYLLPWFHITLIGKQNGATRRPVWGQTVRGCFRWWDIRGFYTHWELILNVTPWHNSPLGWSVEGRDLDACTDIESMSNDCTNIDSISNY